MTGVFQYCHYYDTHSAQQATTTSKATHRPSPNLGLSLSYSYIVTVRLAFMCNVRNGSRSRKNLLQKLGIAYTSRSFD